MVKVGKQAHYIYILINSESIRVFFSAASVLSRHANNEIPLFFCCPTRVLSPYTSSMRKPQKMARPIACTFLYFWFQLNWRRPAFFALLRSIFLSRIAGGRCRRTRREKEGGFPSFCFFVHWTAGQNSL